MDTHCKTIGQRIKQERVALGLSQDWVAGRANITGTEFRQIETGRTLSNLPTLLRIANALQIPWEELVLSKQG